MKQTNQETINTYRQTMSILSEVSSLRRNGAGRKYPSSFKIRVANIYKKQPWGTKGSFCKIIGITPVTINNWVKIVDSGKYYYSDIGTLTRY